MNELSLRSLDSSASDFAEKLEALLDRKHADNGGVEQVVATIIKDVRERGDAALLEYTRRFDRIEVKDPAQLEISAARLQQALRELPVQQRAALEAAADRIRAFHEHQQEESWEVQEQDGTRLGQRVTPLTRVGLYVPGGKAAYPSSVLMNAIPAKVAGVEQLVMVVPTPDGEQNKLVLAAAALAGINRVFAIGGAQAIAALAYGTETVPAVDKIVGPGNIYVATAKRQVFGKVGIDMIAGPSEVVVVCDDSVDPQWAAMDMFAQAEHDELAQSILISPQREVIEQVRAAIEQLLPTLERADIVRAALAGQGALVKVADWAEAARVVNRIAPEHLELLMDNPGQVLDLVKNAGAVFVGRYSAEALGDYCAGPNHVLPTAGSARFSSPLGVYDFQKRTSLIQCSAQGAAQLAETASILARAEGLTAHARSAEFRRKS